MLRNVLSHAMTLREIATLISDPGFSLIPAQDTSKVLGLLVKASQLKTGGNMSIEGERNIISVIFRNVPPILRKLAMELSH